MLDLLTDPQAWASLLTLTVLEVVLGIDNLIFLSILAARAPEDKRDAVRRWGLGGALVTRLVLLMSIAWIASLTEPFFSAFGLDISWRDLVLFGGGLFLLVKGTTEIHAAVEGDGHESNTRSMGFAMAIAQIAVLDIVFSLDSVITAVGIADHVEIMVLAIVISMAVMLFAARPVGGFVERHPTIKILALSFLILVGASLVADGLHFHIPRGYIYFAIAFSMSVEALNLWAAKRRRMSKGGQGKPAE
ncbi:MAG: TerC family protein [Rhodobiaceae bacterium]|nr:TerC family protein [Rhodobiaceae bacterium]